MPLTTLRSRTLAAAAVGALTLSGTALAAHPKAQKKYGGSTSEAKVNGHKPTVTFKVSKDGRKLLHFTYQTAGCYTVIGTGAAATLSKQDLGTVSVSKSGTFSRKNVLTRRTAGIETFTTRSTVTGHFKTASTAVGTITFTQIASGKDVPTLKPCGPEKVTFTATQAKPQQSGGGNGPGGY